MFTQYFACSPVTRTANCSTERTGIEERVLRPLTAGATMKLIQKCLGVGTVCVAAAAAAFVGPIFSHPAQAVGLPSTNGVVGHWVDGDTLELRSGVRVRLIGVDTPERGDCGYDAATRVAKRLAPAGTRVTVVNPPSVDDRDRYDRLLRYVMRSGNDVGLRQIKRGAKARYDGRDGYDRHPRQDLYRRTDREHRDYPRSCGGGGGGGGGGGHCAPGYSRCVPPPPPDLDCVDLRAPIGVFGSDPHNFDADGDGVGCETASGGGY
ncbi:thermonuclease family protein [Nocardioides humilatus]|uniref:Thermonuclease family protein n=1 Tax=Nocardioides humilatus TaxID=2607660 RepID=A0A5B1LKZ7_9ACTN|nr:thermonuclease family protein [Nocardioides humilatus]KAA1421243.1 thermonuclease family protein [Nocardioides humilatus]